MGQQGVRGDVAVSGPGRRWNRLGWWLYYRLYNVRQGRAK